jgi:hypothetical protein
MKIEGRDWSSGQLVEKTDASLNQCKLSKWRDVRDVGGLAEDKHTLLTGARSDSEWIVTDRLMAAEDWEDAGGGDD